MINYYYQFVPPNWVSFIFWYFEYFKQFYFTTHNITNRGFYAESSEEEDSEPEFVPETEETWLDNIGKTADFLDNHVLFTSEDVVSCFNDPGVATSMLTEIAHEVESEYTEYIFTIDMTL